MFRARDFLFVDAIILLTDNLYYCYFGTFIGNNFS